MSKCITPPRGEPMPRSIEYYVKRGDMDQELILRQAEEISKLKSKINNLKQKLKSNKNTSK